MKYTQSESKQYARDNMRGIFTAPCTPDDANGDVDEAGVRHDVNHLIETIGAHGLYWHGNYGNFWLLTVEERNRTIDIVLDEAAGRVPVMCRCAHQSLKDTINLMQHATESGADFISIMPPLLGRDNPEMVLNYFKAAASETNLGLSVFNTPQAGYMLSPELMAEIAEIENVVALKNHAGVEHTNEIRRLVGDDILVVDPDEPNFLMSVKDHGQQAIFTGTNMMFDSARARPMRDYVEAALAGDFDLATQIRTDMQPIRDMHDKWVMTPWEAQGVCPVSIIKFWTKQLGMTGGVGRSPLVGFSEEGQQGLVADLEAVGLVPEGSLAR